MSTTRARSLASFTAASTGPLVLPPADRNTWSAPRPLVILASSASTRVQVVRRPAGDRAGLLRQTAAVGDRVDADRLHAGRDQQPDHELADQAEADDGRGLAELDLGAAHAVHGDRGHGGERGVLGQHPGGHGRAQVDRHPVVLGVQRLLVARARDELADLELLGALADLGDHAAQRVAERGVGVELVHHLLVGGGKPLLLHLVENLLHLVRPGPRHADHRHAGLGDLHHLGAGRDQREQRPDEHAAGTAGRGGHVENRQLSRLVVLGYLLHQVPQLVTKTITLLRPQRAPGGTTAPSTAAARSAWRSPRGPPARPRSAAAAAPCGASRAGRARRRPARR